ncbi:MAG: hypothetical protein CVV45_00680 [Spirochaetae bacterium HGW-Spirochaetae-10]|nr:MAG: hypothetical protein CVV45_00680 [Spirochaetae bacterium HGW-Spirochaetae-10]
MRRLIITKDLSVTISIRRQIKEVRRQIFPHVAVMDDAGVLKELYDLLHGFLAHSEHRIESYETRANSFSQLLAFFLAPSFAAVPFLFDRVLDDQSPSIWLWLFAGSLFCLSVVFIGVSAFRTSFPFGLPVRSELRIPRVIAASSDSDGPLYYKSRTIDLAEHWVAVSLRVQYALRRLWIIRAASILFLGGIIIGGANAYLSSGPQPDRGASTGGKISAGGDVNKRLKSLEETVKKLEKENGLLEPNVNILK